MVVIPWRRQRNLTWGIEMIRTENDDRVDFRRRGLSFGRCGALACLVLLIAAGDGADARGDEFDRLDGAALFDIPGRATGVKSPSALSYQDLEALPSVLPDERAAFVIVKSDQGNLAKILVSGAFKKLSVRDQEAKTVPVLLIERFETIDSGDRRSFKARGKGVTLFDGFQFDLDSGQVVPDQAGGDIRFTASAPGEPRLTALGTSRLYVLEKPLARAPAAKGQPSYGREVLATDYSGRFDLVADGQWSGRLELSVDAAGMVAGFFRSEKNGSSYAVTGKAGDGVPQRIRFEVRFPRATQSYDGLIWSEGKNVIAGTVTMLDHPYSFVAIREGASLKLVENAGRPDPHARSGAEEPIVPGRAEHKTAPKR
jgi:hypothetical protein